MDKSPGLAKQTRGEQPKAQGVKEQKSQVEHDLDLVPLNKQTLEAT